VSMDLDTRQRAMLLEMGVRVWWPKAEWAASESLTRAPGAPVMPSERPARVAGVATQSLSAVSEPARAAVGAATPPLIPTKPASPVDQMDWPQLARAVRACTACGLCEGRKATVFVSDPAPTQADWLIVGEAPDEQEERAGSPFVGEAGQLLDNMLRAVQCQRAGQGAGGARLTPVVKCRPAVVRPPTAQELAQCAVFLRREIDLTRPRVILAMGRFAAMSLLAEDYPQVLQMPLGQLRGGEFQVKGIPVVVTYHPVKLLRAPQEKANAWVDLCRARKLILGAV